MRRNWSLIIAIGIEVAIVIVAMPRWIPALMLADGYPIPASWGTWWTPVSAIFSAAMAVAEAVAIAYVSAALNRTRGWETYRLLTLLMLVMLSFTVVLAPFVSASVAGTTLDDILNNPGAHAMQIVWGSAVVLSTGLTVMAVSQAQFAHGGEERKPKYTCWCGGFQSDSDDDWLDHQDIHKEEVLGFSSNEEALSGVMTKYGQLRENILPPPPRLVDIVRWRAEGIMNDGLYEPKSIT